MSDKEFSNFSKCHRLWPSLQSHICLYIQPPSSLVSIDFALRWRGSPWCPHRSHPEVTNDDQNNFCWEAARGESVSRLPPASWVQLLKMTATAWIMQQLPALAWSMMYATRARADIKEKGQRLQASDQKPASEKKKQRKAATQQLKRQRATGLLNKLHWTPALCRSHLLRLIVFTAELLFAFVCSCSGLRRRCRGMFYSKENYMSVYNDSHYFK